MLKRITYFCLAVVVLTACSTTKETEIEIVEKKLYPIGKRIVPPIGITFTDINNYKGFASILMPYQGGKFGKQESSNFNDAGEMVPTCKYGGFHVYGYYDLSRMVKIKGDKNDINTALESFKESSFLRRMLKKENVKEENSDVVIAEKTCKRILVSYSFSKGDYSDVTYTLGYIVPHNKTTALFCIDKGKTSPAGLEKDVKILDDVFKYMVETVKFREYSK
ncbi:MAG: hypothetical protein JEY94_08550 [Melioribacteraceae bacterium]|nr:hypothetical protein [Melioribacteraceae bacterium]